MKGKIKFGKGASWVGEIVIGERVSGNPMGHSWEG